MLAETSILMVVHGGPAMTRLAVLRTLRHSADADSRLVVADTAPAVLDDCETEPIVFAHTLHRRP